MRWEATCCVFCCANDTVLARVASNADGGGGFVCPTCWRERRVELVGPWRRPGTFPSCADCFWWSEDLPEGNQCEHPDREHNLPSSWGDKLLREDGTLWTLSGDCCRGWRMDEENESGR